MNTIANSQPKINIDIESKEFQKLYLIELINSLVDQDSRIARLSIVITILNTLERLQVFPETK